MLNGDKYASVQVRYTTHEVMVVKGPVYGVDDGEIIFSLQRESYLALMRAMEDVKLCVFGGTSGVHYPPIDSFEDKFTLKMKYHGELLWDSRIPDVNGGLVWWQSRDKVHLHLDICSYRRDDTLAIRLMLKSANLVYRPTYLKNSIIEPGKMTWFK